MRSPVFDQLPKIVIFSSKGKLSNQSVRRLEYWAKFTQFEPNLHQPTFEELGWVEA